MIQWIVFWAWSWVSDCLCFIGCHDWRNGPGYPCVECGHPDDFPWDE